MRQFVLVAGFDYFLKKVNFGRLCDRRAKRIIRANKARTDLRFLRMHVGEGTVTVWEVSYPGGEKKEVITSSRPFKAVSRSNYDADHAFKDGQSGYMSITDVYEAIRSIGRSEPGTLEEVSFFSHGWINGPILLNSSDDRTYQASAPGLLPMTLPVSPPTARDPDDYDPRAQYDFVAPTMDAAARTELQDAFADDGLVWIWGCNASEAINGLLTRLQKHPEYKRRGLADDHVFTLDLADDEARFINAVIPGLVPVPVPRRVSLTFGELRRAVCLLNLSSYPPRLADAAQVPVYAAARGTYATYGPGEGDLLYVPKQFRRHVRFYENYLGFTFDSAGRRYAIFPPGMSCPAPATP